MTKRMKRLFAAAGLCLTALAAVWIQAGVLPDSLYVTNEDEPVLAVSSYIKVEPIGGCDSETGDAYTAQARLLGVLPVKNIRIKVVEEKTVALMGVPVGVKLHTNGVVVSGISDVITAKGAVNPGELAGLTEGDAITAINGKPVSTTQQLTKLIFASKGKELKLDVIGADGEKKRLSLRPVYSLADSCYRAGIWVRDSSAGIGVLTYIDPENNSFGGLGHAICEQGSDIALPVADGELTSVVLTGMVAGASGAPGELIGYLGDDTLGSLTANNASGIFGSYTAKYSREHLCRAAAKQSIQEGAAKMLTTMPGNDKPELYDIEITKINYNSDNPTRNMTIKVTDERLLSTVGGIVQGMSGSPIIQNEKFVGAVTHVFVNDPAKGFAIFAETMLYYNENGRINEKVSA